MEKKEKKKGKVQKRIVIVILAVLLALGGTAGGILAYRMMQQTEPVLEGNKADVAWYSESGKEFTITTADELYELSLLSDYYDFKGQTIRLGADIVVNEGNASDWAENAPENLWFPIQGFAGTFDGRGHTISGLYGVGVSMSMGLFSDTNSKCKITDLRVVNSYFTGDRGYAVGSISSNGSGTFEKIYSDAIISTHFDYAGGLIGVINSGKESSVTLRSSMITNCWFNGKVNLLDSTSRMGGGIVGAVTMGNVNISHCLSSGIIQCADAQESYSAGGFCGRVGDASATVQSSLHIEDCLHTGNVNSPYRTGAGTFVGVVVNKGVLVMQGDYGKKSDYDACGANLGSKTGAALDIKPEYLIGEEAYRWTTLDFDRYWTALSEDEPMLTYFVKGAEALNLNGVKKAFNTDWYDESAKEYRLTSVEDLYGFSMLCNFGNTFDGKAIKLDADIIVNAGKASDWAKGKNLPN